MRVTIYCLLLAVATLAFYNPIVRNTFTDFDDSVYILRNPQIRSGLNWATVKWSFTTFHAGYWHPLTWLSHALDCQLFHLSPVDHHYVNLLLHAANAVLLFLLLQSATGLTWPSLIVGALFALHPLNVESVAWVAERKNVLSMLFFLLALYAHDRYARTGKRYFYWCVTALFALGLMAKPQIVTLPFVLLLWDYWPLQRIDPQPPDESSNAAPAPHSFGYLVWEKWPIFLLAAADSVVTILAQRSVGAIRSASQVPFAMRFANVPVSYLRYIGKIFWPSRLAPMYPHSATPLQNWQTVGSLALLLVVTAFVLRWHERRYLFVGWFWFLGTLVPMIGLITVGEQSMADRFAYIPLIGLLIAIVWSINAIVTASRIPAMYAAAAAGVIIVVLGGLTHRQLGYWRDDETLWRYTLSVTENNYMAHDNLAIALAKQWKIDEAIREFHIAESLYRYPPAQVLTLALFELQVGRPQDAVDDCNSVLRASNDPQVQAAAWSELGQGQLQLHHYEQAADGFENALRLSPANGMALLGAGVLALRDGKSDAAVTQFSRAMKLDSSPISLLLLAQALRRAGRPAEADSAVLQARKISPNLTQAQRATGQFLAFVGLKPL